MMDAVVGWQVKGRLAAVARIMVRREGGRGRSSRTLADDYERGWVGGKASSLQRSLSAIFGVLPSHCLYPLLSHSVLVSLSLLPHIHSLV